ncbi:MAG: hypothetical protein JSV27_10615 [Candidatus Bathyarchaeota archaeon]|nr:MAG: hypothetical protein JSV27_10615 [Candidatus Bathyarchaeota archaeon]
MSADPSMMADDPQTVQAEQAVMVAKDLTAEPIEEIDLEEYQDPPLNAEEATILVVHFLQRMRKKVITPRKATLNGDNVFVVNVDLQDALATVHINADDREIIEYSIEPIEKEKQPPIPIPTRKIFIGLAAVIVFIVAVMCQSIIMLYAGPFLAGIHTDYYIIGGGLVLVAGVGIFWWRRRG